MKKRITSTLFNYLKGTSATFKFSFFVLFSLIFLSARVSAQIFTSTTTGGAYDQSSTWVGNVVPTPGADVIINGPVTCSTSVNSVNTLTINSGSQKSLTATTGAVIPITLSLVINGTLKFSGTSPAIDIGAGGFLTNNGTFTSSVETINFLGSGVINGTKTTLSIKNLTINAGTLTLTPTTTITGILQVNGGTLSSSVVYSTTSTLSFRTGTTYDVSSGDLFWAAGSSGPGVPNIVEINTTGTNVNIMEDRTATGGITLTNGTLNNNTNVLTIGASGGGRAVFNLNGGTFNNNGGTFSANGNIVMSSGSFNMNSGEINIDPNSGTSTTSVASGTTIWSIISAVNTVVTGGTITFVDPPVSGTGKSLNFSGTSGSNANWAGSTIVFGGSFGINNSSVTNGFNIDTKSSGNGGNYLLLGDVVVNGAYSNKHHTTGSATAANGFDIGGNLTINPTCEIRTLAGGAPLMIIGNIDNYGIFYDLGTLSFSNQSGDPNHIPQVCRAIGDGIFYGSSPGQVMSFGSLVFDNDAPGRSIKLIVGLEVFIGGSVYFKNGAVDVGDSTGFIFATTGSANRVTGFMLRNGPGAMSKQFPVRLKTQTPDTFVYYIADTADTYDYSPMTVISRENTLNGRVISTFVVDKVHPDMNNGGTQTDYISRYWRVINTPLENFNVKATFQYTPGDIVGVETKMQTNLWTGYAWSQAYSNAAKNILTIEKVTEQTWPNDNLTEAWITGRYHQPTTYRWNKTSNTIVYSWIDSSHWTPERRLVSSSDSLIFDGKTAKIKNVRASEVISVLQLKNNSDVTLMSNANPDKTSALLEMVAGIGNVLDIQKGSTLKLSTNVNGTSTYNMSLGFRGKQDANIAGTLYIDTSSTTANNSYDGRNCTTNVSGTIKNGGSVMAGSADSLKIPGTYEHVFTSYAGTFPSFTWSDSTRFKITGYRTLAANQVLTLPAYLRNLTYNCVNQTNELPVSTTPSTIDTFILQSSGTTGTISLKNNTTLRFGGPITYTGGKFRADSATIEMVDTLARSFPAGFFYSKNIKNLTIDNAAGVSLTDSTNVSGTLTVTSGNFNTNDKLVLRSTSIDSTARIAPVLGSITGKAIVERFIPANRRYRLLSPGVTTTGTIRDNWQEAGNNAPGYGTHITGTGGTVNGFDATATNNPSLYYFDNAAQTWVAGTSTTSDGLKAGFGYRLFVRGDRTINLGLNNPTPTKTIMRAKGTLLTGDVTYNTTGINGTPVLNAANDAFNLVGNPYASSINWNDVLKIDGNGNITGNVTDITTSYYIIDPNLSNGSSGVFVNYNADSETSNNTASNMNEHIQPGQGFFVQTVPASVNPSPNPSITFQEANKSTGLTAVYRLSGKKVKLSAQLLVAGDEKNTLDGLVAVFNERFSNNIGLEDSYKLNNSNENIAIAKNGLNLSIEGRPGVNTTDSLPLMLWNYRRTSYVIKFAAQNFDPQLTAFIKDAFLDTETPLDLTGETKFAFSLTADPASSAANRFTIYFKNGSVLPVTVTDVNAYQKDKGIMVNWTSATETGVANYEIEKSVDGQQFVKAGTSQARGNNNQTQAYEWFDANPQAGYNYYRIRIIEKSGSVTYTQIVRVNIGVANTDFSIYPNPVKGKTIGLSLTNLQKGTYQIGINNVTGQQVFTGRIVHNGASGTYTINTGTQISPGVYNLKAKNNTYEIVRQLVVE